MGFTYDDFRGTAELRAAVAEFLHSDVGRIMLRVLRERYKPSDVPSTAGAIASARILSQFHGAHVAIDDLENLAVPPNINPYLEPSFQADGTDHDRMPTNITPEILAHFTSPPPEETDAH
jgi:hypothetical protein